MSKETKDPTKRDRALNDSTSGQFGSEPLPEANPNVEKEDLTKNERDRRERANREKYI